MKKPIRKNNIIKLRKKRGLSRSQLAKQIGVSDAYLRKLESGHAVLTANLLLSLAAKLKVNTHIIADVPVNKKIASKGDDTVVGDAIGWLLQYSDKLQVALSRRELSQWTRYIYDGVIAERLNLHQSRHLVFTVVKAIKSAKKD